VAGAKKSREGKLCSESIIITETDFVYDGPTTRDELWSYKSVDENPFVNRAIGVIQRQRVVVTRPQFPNWKLKFTVSYDDNLVDEDLIEKWITVAGRQIGLGDWRPEYGLFKLVA